MASAQDIIAKLGLNPHPEGGWYVQTWQGDEPGRASGTSILFLLEHGVRSHWHTVDATEIWHFHAGAPLRLFTSETDQGPARVHVLGSDVLGEQSPQAIVPPHHWQAAESTGEWSLVGCTVSPGFEFAGFHMAEPGFDIPFK